MLHRKIIIVIFIKKLAKKFDYWYFIKFHIKSVDFLSIYV